MEPAPLGRRTAAFAIDIAAFFILVWLIGQLMHKFGVRYAGIVELLILMALPPVSALTCWVIGNTPGKKLIGLRIVDEKTGGRPTFWQLLRRCLLFSLLFSFNIVFIIPVLATRKHKGFHDMIAGTMVVEEWQLEEWEDD